MQILAIDHALGQQTNAAGAMHVGGDDSSGRFEIGEYGSALADRLKIVDLESDAGFSRDREQM